MDTDCSLPISIGVSFPLIVVDQYGCQYLYGRLQTDNIFLLLGSVWTYCICMCWTIVCSSCGNEAIQYQSSQTYVSYIRIFIVLHIMCMQT